MTKKEALERNCEKMEALARSAGFKCWSDLGRINMKVKAGELYSQFKLIAASGVISG